MLPGARIFYAASPGDFLPPKGDVLPSPGQDFSIYSIGMWSYPMRLENSTLNATQCADAVLPLLAAKHRVTAGTDCMTTDAEVACPDPDCGSRQGCGGFVAAKRRGANGYYLRRLMVTVCCGMAVLERQLLLVPSH